MFKFNWRSVHKRAIGGWFIMFQDWSAVIAKKRGKYWSELETVRWAAKS